MQKKKRVGVITLPFTPNYGWLLQAYALQRVLERLGYDPILIYRKWNKAKQNSGIFNAVKRWLYYHVLCRKLYDFFIKELSKTRLYRNSQSMQTVVHDYKLDAVVVGSDQIWRPKYFNSNIEDAYLKFAEGWNIKRIAYAASFGTENKKFLRALTFLFNRKLRSLLNKNAPLWMRTPRLRKLVADATALRRECAQERTLFIDGR